MNMREKKREIGMGMCVLILLAIFSVTAFGAPPPPHPPDVQINGTSADDTIYFGYVKIGVTDLLAVAGNIGGWPPAPYYVPTGGRLIIYGNGGNDHIEAVSGETKGGVTFGDITNLSFSSYLLYGGAGNDTIIGKPLDKPIVVYGNDGNDHLIGGAGDDHLYGGAGDDYIDGGSGNDLIYGDDGKDFLMGDKGNDNIYGGAGNDIIVGGIGDDTIEGGSGIDTFRCRKSNYAIADYDAYADEDCNDTDPPLVETVVKRDPYWEWAYMTANGDGVTFDSLTTSNAELLITERAAGASILMSESGDMPLSGDFDRDGKVDDVAIYRSFTQHWYYDWDHNATNDETTEPWSLRGDRPVVGDFDRDGKIDDVAVFRPSNRMWYFDYDHDGDSDDTSGPWGLAGDIPIAGDFNRDGYSDDVAVFRPSNHMWYFDYHHDGDTDVTSGPWGLAGDIPLAGDFDRDGRNDDVALFRPIGAMWFYDYNHNGTTDKKVLGWGFPGDIPLAGDFNRDGKLDDVAVFRPSDKHWYYDYRHDGTTDATYGPWGIVGSPLHTTHKQYGSTCGPGSLAMVMADLGLADTTQRLFFNRDLDAWAEPMDMTVWNPDTAVDVGFHLSMEHIMYEGYHRYFENGSGRVDEWPPEAFNQTDNKLKTGNHAGSGDGDFFQIRYDIGDVNWNPTTKVTSGQVQEWTYHGPAVAFGGEGQYEEGLPYVADKFNESNYLDAYPVDAKFREGVPSSIYRWNAQFKNLDHFKAVVRGFIDHNIPVVVHVDSGNHYNTLVGYWDSSAGFFIYTADPLDGKGRAYHNKPMRWRKIRVTEATFRAGVLTGMMFYHHAETGCTSPSSWARQIDSAYGHVGNFWFFSPDINSLCGHVGFRVE